MDVGLWITHGHIENSLLSLINIIGQLQIGIETLLYNGVTYYKDPEGLVYDGEDTQVGVWDPATESVEFLYG